MVEVTTQEEFDGDLDDFEEESVKHKHNENCIRFQSRLQFNRHKNIENAFSTVYIQPFIKVEDIRVTRYFPSTQRIRSRVSILP